MSTRLSGCALSLFLALVPCAGRAQSDIWEKPSQSDQDALKSFKFNKSSNLNTEGIEGKMTGHWGAAGYQEARLENDGFLDFALKSCLPGIAYRVLNQKAQPEERKALQKLDAYLEGIKQDGGAPYYSAYDFGAAIDKKDFEQSSLACRRTIVDIEASRFLDVDPRNASNNANKVVEKADVLSLLKNHGDESAFTDRKGGARLFELIQYKYISPYELLAKKDPEMMQLRCRLAETLGAAIQVFDEGNCDQLWPESD